MQLLHCGADPWSAADALVGLRVLTTISHRREKPAGGPAADQGADQGVCPTNRHTLMSRAKSRKRLSTPTTRARSAGASSAWQPRTPALTAIVGHWPAELSRYTG